MTIARKPYRRPPPSRGRARGAEGLKALVQRLAREKRTVRLDGKARRVTTAEALVLVLVARAAKGDVRAYEMVQDLQAKLGNTVINGGYMLAPEALSNEEWIAREMEKNKHRKPPPMPDDMAELAADETE
jgi:hypothetical protein